MNSQDGHPPQTPPFRIKPFPLLSDLGLEPDAATLAELEAEGARDDLIDMYRRGFFHEARAGHLVIESVLGQARTKGTRRPTPLWQVGPGTILYRVRVWDDRDPTLFVQWTRDGAIAAFGLQTLPATKAAKILPGLIRAVRRTHGGGRPTSWGPDKRNTADYILETLDRGKSWHEIERGIEENIRQFQRGRVHKLYCLKPRRTLQRWVERRRRELDAGYQH